MEQVLPAMRFTTGPSRLQIRSSVGNIQDLGLRSLTTMDEFDSVPMKQGGQVLLWRASEPDWPSGKAF